jgi:hypothetical protein
MRFGICCGLTIRPMATSDCRAANPRDRIREPMSDYSNPPSFQPARRTFINPQRKTSGVPKACPIFRPILTLKLHFSNMMSAVVIALVWPCLDSGKYNHVTYYQMISGSKWISATLLLFLLPITYGLINLDALFRAPNKMIMSRRTDADSMNIRQGGATPSVSFC